VADDAIKPAVVAALVKDGWTITHDPYTLKVGGVRVQADIGAERIIAAERGADRIAVEIKSFLSPSPVSDFHDALGQYLMYWSLIRRGDPDRRLYLAVSEDVQQTVLPREGVRFVLDDFPVAFVVVRLSSEEVVTWIESPTTGPS